MGCPGDQRTAGGGVLLQKSLSLVHCRGLEHFSPLATTSLQLLQPFSRRSAGVFLCQAHGAESGDQGVGLSYSDNPENFYGYELDPCTNNEIHRLPNPGGAEKTVLHPLNKDGRKHDLYQDWHSVLCISGEW